MARLARAELFRPDEIATVHIYNQCVRALHLMGIDPSGIDRSYRKQWFVDALQYCAMYFGIDLLEYSVMDNHFHTMLRSRPDVVLAWDDREVARRWLMLCPKRKGKDGLAKEPTEEELRSVILDPDMLKEQRSRLSDFSWFIRKVCQPIAQRANAEEGKHGKFWDGRFNAVRLLDEEAVLACSAYINLNPIRAVLADTLEESDYTSIQKRIQDLLEVAEQSPGAVDAEAAQTGETELLDDQLPGDQAAGVTADEQSSAPAASEPTTISGRLTAQLDEVRAEAHADQAQPKHEPSPEFVAWQRFKPVRWSQAGYLAPLQVDQSQRPCDACLSRSRQRCSDKGYLEMSRAKYIELVDWTGRQIRVDKPGATPEDTPPVPVRLGVSEEVWLKLVTSFSEMFSIVAGLPESVDAHRGTRGQRFHMKAKTRQLFSPPAPAASAAPTADPAADIAADVASPSHLPQTT